MTKKGIEDDRGKLISAKTLAKLLSVSQRTVWRLVSSGKLPEMVSLGGSKRFVMSDIDLFIECGCDMDVYRARNETMFYGNGLRR